MSEIEHKRQIAGSQAHDTELRLDRMTDAEMVEIVRQATDRLADYEARIDELEELLRLVHVDVVRATGVLVDLDVKIAAALNKGAGPGPPA
jgi:transposase